MPPSISTAESFFVVPELVRRNGVVVVAVGLQQFGNFRKLGGASGIGQAAPCRTGRRARVVERSAQIQPIARDADQRFAVTGSVSVVPSPLPAIHSPAIWFFNSSAIQMPLVVHAKSWCAFAQTALAAGFVNSIAPSGNR